MHVKHYHYISWPDHGVPKIAFSLVYLIQHIQKNRKFVSGNPMVIHCSAGVGRTGTFIALSILLEKIKTESAINVFERVNQLRKKRLFMVQALVGRFDFLSILI